MAEPYKVLLVGASGRGKTYSLRNMNRATTGYLNVEKKPLPFKGDFKFNVSPSTHYEVLETMKLFSQNPEISTIVIDSFSAYIDMVMLEARKVKKGYDVFNFYNEQIGLFNSYVKQIRKETFVTAHYEVIADELGGSKERRAKVKGKEWEGFIEKDYTIVLFTESKIIPGQAKPKHYFTLVNDGTSSTKIPPEVFGEEVLDCDNDSNLVLQKLKEFSS